LAQIQALSPEHRADVFSFQEHRQCFLPPVLQGEDLTIAEEWQTEAEDSKGLAPGQEGQQTEVEGSKGLGSSQEEHQDEERQMEDPKQEAETSNPLSESALVITPGKSSK
jgi:hypothetical protein